MEDHDSQRLDSANIPERSACALRDLERRAQAALQASRDHVARLEAEITGQLEQIAAALHEQSGGESPHIAEIEAERAAWADERSALEASRNELSDQLGQLKAEQQAIKEQWQKQLAEFEEKLGQQQANWNEQRSAWTEERETLNRERDELRQKFDLALEDVQRLRGRVAELEQELARRPEANEADSAELVALRAERDALSERVEQLERQPEAQLDASSEQQLADLQRRFELAVEDVRELKTKNAQLEDKLASTRGRSGAAADCGSMDWESQKARLLASLQDEGDPDDDPVRRKERTTITGTIEMTDAIVAEKDKEIAELKARLAADGDGPNPDAEDVRNQKIAELVDADEIVAEHRKRIAQLEREMQEKLRAAELELSVERAKIARQKSELEDLRAELEAQRSANAPQGGSANPGAPRRRWLSKLGLNGEDP